MKVKSTLSYLLKVLATICLCTILLSPPDVVDASCPTRYHQMQKPRMLQRRLHRHHPMQYYYPPSYGHNIGRSSFGTLMNEIFSMPIYFNELARQHDERISHLLHQSTAPRYEISEDDDAFELVLDVPGAKAEDLNIQLEEGGTILRVSGSRNHRRANGQITSYEFDQAFTMDTDNVDVDGMSVSLSGGILRIHAPKVKKASEEPRRIPIEYKEEEKEKDGGDVSDGGKKEEENTIGDVDGAKKEEEKEIQHNEVVGEKVEEKKIGVEEVDGLTITEDE